VDETLSLPVETPAVAAPDEPAADAAPSALEDPEPEPAVDTEPEPEPAVDAEPEPEPAIDTLPEPEPEAPPGASAAGDMAPGPALGPEAVPAGAAVALAESVNPPTAVEVPRPANEAIPAVPPTAGTGPIGSIPAAHARAVWSRLQASNWRLFLIRFLSAGLAVVATVAIVPGLGFTGWRWGEFARIAFIFGLLNATVKPLLQFLVLRFIFSTYGIVVVVINTLLLLLLGAILEGTFEVYRPISLVVGGVVVGILGLVLETLLGATPPVLDRDYKERNGLR
jgi:uncharacterized membrane protein YvlD (DUF360 family)